MTSQLRALVRVQLLNAWRSFRDNATGKSRWGVVLIPLLFLCFVPVLYVIWQADFALYSAGAQQGQGHLVLVIAFIAGQIACLMFGVFYVISAFFFSKDLRILVPMPIRPGEIVLAKFISILIGEYLTMVPLVAPALLIYGFSADVAWTYWPFALIIFLLLPVIPLVLASLFSLVLMRITNLRRSRDLWRVLGALVGVAFAIGFQFVNRLFMNGSEGPSSDALERLVAAQPDLAATVGQYVPTSVWATNALKAGAPAFGIVFFLIFVSVSAIALLSLMWVAEKLFFGGLVGGEEVRKSGKVLSQDELTRHTAQARSPLWALLQREIKMLNRTPSFLMAAVMPLVLLPVLAVISFSQEEQLAQFAPDLRAIADSPLAAVVAIGGVLLMNGFSSLAATAISREGRHFWISRSLPVAPRVQVQAKAIHSLIFSLLNILLIGAGMYFYEFLRPLTVVYLVIGGLLGSLATGYGSLAIDLLRPNLKWTDPQQAMKGNLNILFGMLLIYLMGGIWALAAWLLHSWAPSVMMPALLLLLAAEAIGLGKFVGALADRRYAEYED